MPPPTESSFALSGASFRLTMTAPVQRCWPVSARIDRGSVRVSVAWKLSPCLSLYARQEYFLNAPAGATIHRYTSFGVGKSGQN